MAREINLVPDIKGEMIKALKLRNLTFFICIVVAAASLATTAIVAAIAGGQQAIVNGKKDTISKLSSKIQSYDDLDNFLTIKDQLSDLSTIASNKKLLSRTFGLLAAIFPSTIKISELDINLSSGSPVISFDAQANADTPPYIDYNVLDSFKKSMKYLRYDYGEYVDKDGNSIPAYCMIETDNSGSILHDQEKGYYAYWLITGEGCDPAYEPDNDSDEDAAYAISADEMSRINEAYTLETYNNQTVVRIWRTPQYDDWYSEDEVEGEPYMSLDGEISGVAHFESRCINYSGTLNSNTGIVNWSHENEDCMLVPKEDDGINISDSSNGRDTNGELVLRFSADITLSQEYYEFGNSHMLAIGPTGRYNVTDSYVQIQNIFGAPATDCDINDAACNSNSNGGNNG